VIVLCLVPDLPYPEGLHQPVLEPHTVDVPEVLSVVMSVHQQAQVLQTGGAAHPLRREIQKDHQREPLETPRDVLRPQFIPSDYT
jgi:hypothetical protein